jgi:NADP-dependent alcohol dehydrogenase
MENFTWHNPTRIHFGRGQIAALDHELPAEARILLVAGGGSIRANGVHDQVKAALGKRTVHEHWGVEANPDYDTLMPAVELCRKERIDHVLAVGGGSVIDGAKFICAAVPFDGEPWDILARRAEIQSALPLTTVLTLPGTGTESNGAAVISRRKAGEKLAFIHPLVYPRVSIIDPETTFSLPERQIANGVADAFTHILEQYLTFPAEAAVQDGFAEALLRILVTKGPRTVSEPQDYALRANICWAATWALNGSLGVGVPQDWASHMIGHELTALHGIDHARTLAVVMPALIQAGGDEKGAKLAQMGERVWGIQIGDTAARAAATIELIRGFYASMGLPTRLGAYDIAADALADEIAGRLDKRGMLPLGERGSIDADRIRRILFTAA